MNMKAIPEHIKNEHRLAFLREKWKQHVKNRRTGNIQEHAEKWPPGGMLLTFPPGG
jgi:hypothetical protein